MNTCEIVSFSGRSVIALSLFAATSMLLMASNQAQADPVVKLGTYSFLPGQASIPVQVFAFQDPSTGINGSVQGIDLNMGIHDLSGNPAGANGPRFTAGLPGQGWASNSAYVGGVGANGAIGGDVLTGTIYGAYPHHGIPNDGGLSVSQDLGSVSVTTGSTDALPLGGVANPSLIATVYISTVGVAAGTHWVLSIGGYQNGDPGPDQGPLDFTDGQSFNTTLIDGVINVVPEPSSIALAALGIDGLAAWGWRRRKR